MTLPETFAQVISGRPWRSGCNQFSKSCNCFSWLWRQKPLRLMPGASTRVAARVSRSSPLSSSYYHCTDVSKRKKCLPGDLYLFCFLWLFSSILVREKSRTFFRDLLVSEADLLRMQFTRGIKTDLSCIVEGETHEER